MTDDHVKEDACTGISGSVDGEPKCQAPQARRRSAPKLPDASNSGIYSCSNVSGRFSRCQSTVQTIEGNVQMRQSMAASSDSPRPPNAPNVLKFNLAHGVPSSSLENSSLTESQVSSQTRSSRSEQGTTDTDQKSRTNHEESERNKSDDDVYMEDSESDGQVKTGNISEGRTSNGADKVEHSSASNKENSSSSSDLINARLKNAFQRSRQHHTQQVGDEDGPKIRHHIYKTSLNSARGKKRMKTTASSLTTVDESEISQVEVEVSAGASGVSTPGSEGKTNDTKCVTNSNPTPVNDADPSFDNHVNDKGDIGTDNNDSNHNNIADDSKSDTSNSSNFYSTSSDEYIMETDRCSSGYDGGKSGSNNGDSGISSDSNSGSGSSGNNNRGRTIISSLNRRYRIHTHHGENSIENSCEGGSSGSDDGYNGYYLRSSGEDGNETDNRPSKNSKLGASPTTSSSSSSSDRSSSEDNMEIYGINVAKIKGRSDETVTAKRQDSPDDRKNKSNDSPAKTKTKQLYTQSERSSSMHISTSAATTTSETMSNSNSNSSGSLNRGNSSNIAGDSKSDTTKAENGDGSGGRVMNANETGSGSGSGSGSGTTGESNDSGGDNENKSSNKSSSSSAASTLIKNNSSFITNNMGKISSDKIDVSSHSQISQRVKMSAPYFYYKDCSQEREEDLMTPLVKPLHSPSFVMKLHAVLMRDDLKSIISWLPHGRSWKIIHEREFEIRTLPIYFNLKKISSFHEQAAEWGFQRFKTGPDQGTFYHERFLRGLPHLCKKMKNASLSRSMVDVEHIEEFVEPNFWQISLEHPVPEKLDPQDVQSIELKKINECILEKGHRAKVPASFMRKKKSMSLEIQNEAAKRIVSERPNRRPVGVGGTAFRVPAKFRRQDLNSKDEIQLEPETKPNESKGGEKDGRIGSQVSAQLSNSRGNAKIETLPTNEQMHASLQEVKPTQDQIQWQLLDHGHDQEQRTNHSNHVSGMLYSLQTSMLEQQQQRQQQTRRNEQKQQASFASSTLPQNIRRSDQLTILQSNLRRLQAQQQHSPNQSSFQQADAHAQQNATRPVNPSISASQANLVQYQSQAQPTCQQEQQCNTSYGNQPANNSITEFAKAILAATDVASSNHSQHSTSIGSNVPSLENLMTLINHVHRVGSADPNVLAHLTQVLGGNRDAPAAVQQNLQVGVSSHQLRLPSENQTHQQQQKQQNHHSSPFQNADNFTAVTLDTPVSQLSPQIVQNLILQCIAAGAQLASRREQMHNQGNDGNNATNSSMGHSNQNHMPPHGGCN
mmetsp:Transcript_3695/g.7853  ORF Transcript_3695/g.7853 Transcript_3695/m.7853 type:complete len:1286 (-) Transcript_3695:202-4059(-)